MHSYTYPIKIDRKRRTIYFKETRAFDNDSLTLEDLAFVGEDCFSISERADMWGGCIISVTRSRLESDDEMQTRISEDKSYMAEYKRRKIIRETAK